MAAASSLSSSSSSLSSLLVKLRRMCVFRLLPFPFSKQRRPLSPYSTDVTSSSPDSFTVQFLTANCDVPLAAAISAARSVRINESSTESPLAVLSLLRSHGLSPSQVGLVVSRRPTILLSRPDRTLAPKLRFLSSIFPRTHLPDLIATNPTLLSRSLKAQIEPIFAILCCFLDSPDALLVAVHRHPRLLTSNLPATVAPNIALLTSLGVPSDHIGKLLATHPRSLFQPADRFAEAVNIVSTLGLRPGLCLFIHAVRVMNGMGRSTWEARYGFFRNLGWSEEEFRIAFQKAPLFVLVSEPKVQKMVAFLMEYIGLKASDLFRHPKLLMYSLENRLLPRFKVFCMLQAKGLVKYATEGKRRSLLMVMFTSSEGMFLDRYVQRYNQVASELMDVYNGKVGVEVSRWSLGKMPKGRVETS